MEKVVRIGLLADFYGELLTDKQKRLVDLYYNNDLSLAEIAQEFNVSRQAVFDILKRAERSLSEYEDKLKLVQRFQEQQVKVGKSLRLIEQLLNGISDSLSESQISQFNKVKKAITELINELDEG
jgi:predicted DNA-binding protein YlxM (UPF0122 family)